MKLIDLLPHRVRGNSHAASVFVASVAAALLFAAVGLGSALSSGGADWTNGSSALLVLAAIPCAVIARGISIGRIDTPPGIDRAAFVALLLFAITNYQQLLVHPKDADHLTAQACLMVAIAGLVIRNHRLQFLVWVTYLVPWLAVVQVTHPINFRIGSWLSTWAVACGLSAAVSLITATERHVNRGLIGTVRSAAHTDVLTGLANRAGFIEQAPQVLARAQLRGGGIWCGFVDVDGFKAVNDELGHDTGDRVLVAVGQAIERVARDTDLFARWGGDEFIVLGPGSAPDSHSLESRLHARLERLPSEILQLWPATVTIGVAGVEDATSTDLQSLIAAADSAMYQRRRESGRSKR